MESGENAIQQAIQMLDTATSLATEAAGSTPTADQRLDEVPQVQGILQQLVSLSQTAVNGQYIFSGRPEWAGAVHAGRGRKFRPAELSGGRAAGQSRIANGVMISIGLTAQQIFDDQVGGGGHRKSGAG